MSSMLLAKLTFVVTFLLFLIVPVADTVHPFIWTPRLTENRLPAKPPDFGAVLRGDGSLAEETGRWLDDRLGPRPLLIAVKNQLDYWLFRYSSKIFVGRDGWLFQPSFFDAEVSASRAGDPKVGATEQYFISLANYLASRHIRLIIIANPIKRTIYPQFVPDDAPQLPADTLFQKMRRFLKSHRNWIYIDGQDVLTTKCPGVVLFNHIDLHPTFPTGVCMARELVGRVATAEGRSHSPWDHRFSWTTVRSTSGGEGNFMALLYPIAQESYIVDRIFETGAPTNEGDFAQDSHHLAEWSFHTRPPYRTSKFPSAVVYGDSFVDHYAEAGFFTYFKDVYRIRDSGSNLDQLLQHLPLGTRYFVYEFIEPFTGGLTPFHARPAQNAIK
jgi:hypothetical protein